MKVKEILTPGGYLVLTVPADPGLWSYFDEASHHQRRYTRETLAEMLNGTGFEIVRLTAFMSLTYPWVWLRRKFGRKAEPNYTEEDASSLAYQELAVNKVLNWLLIQILKLERSRIKQGKDFRRGSSLLAVARRRFN